MNRTQSMVVLGTQEKAATALGFAKFQRSRESWVVITLSFAFAFLPSLKRGLSLLAVTTILATMLERGILVSLLAAVEAKVRDDEGLDSKLEVIEVKDIMEILETMGKQDW